MGDIHALDKPMETEPSLLVLQLTNGLLYISKIAKGHHTMLE